jgi:hypothetical protein
LDSYEKSDGQKEPKKAVEDVYTQYQQTGITATFPGNKYIGNRQNDRAQFDSDLESFRYLEELCIHVMLESKIREDLNKRKYLSQNLFQKQRLKCRNCAQVLLYSHMKKFLAVRKLTHLILDIDRHLKLTGADQLLTPEDSNLIRLQHNSHQIDDADKYGSQEDVSGPRAEIIIEETRPLTADELLDIEAEKEFSSGRDAEFIEDDWIIEEETKDEEIAES